MRPAGKLTGMRVAAVLLLPLAACLLSGVAARPRAGGTQRRAATENVSVRVRGRSAVVVTERGRAHTLDLSKQADAARIENVSALLLTRRGGFTYLLLDVCGASKLRPDDRQCGAGTECNVIWLQLDRAWRARDAKSERYESCWLPITSEEGPKVGGRRMTLVFEDLREEGRREVTYDADSPEEGLTVRRYDIPKTTP